ncbi:MAG: guanylate kinase [Pyrinomonadaceae bacterium]|nr:guanylate kinase [Pyrinomonadaceae bacterium]
MKGTVFIISSPSGGGKGTLIKEILQRQENIGYSVSYTTRKMREGEIHGQHYFFISKAEFEQLISKDEFLEYAEVHGNYYGTSKTQVLSETEKGNDIILEIDVQGAEIIKPKLPEAVGIFILPPSFPVLRERLINRQTESAEDLALRLANSRSEVEKYSEFDYVVINEFVEKATLELQSIVLAERLKTNKQTDKINFILDTF